MARHLLYPSHTPGTPMLLLLSLFACDDPTITGGPAEGTCETSSVTLLFQNPDDTVPVGYEAEIQWYNEGYALISCTDGEPVGVTEPTDNIRCIVGGVQVDTDATALSVDIFGTEEGFSKAGSVEIEWDGDECATGSANVLLDSEGCGDCG